MQEQILISVPVEDFRNMVSESIREQLENFQHVPPPIEERYHTRKETAKRLRISLPTLTEYTKKKLIKGSRIGARLLYSESAIQEALSNPKIRR